jgi:hypothetical protein
MSARTAQPTLATVDLKPNQGLLVKQEVCLVTRLVSREDGSTDVHLDRDLDDPLVLHVPFSSLAEPLWIPVAHCCCPARMHDAYWMAWGWAQPDGPFWCDGSH